jgi:hypothetical protein
MAALSNTTNNTTNPVSSDSLLVDESYEEKIQKRIFSLQQLEAPLPETATKLKVDPPAAEILVPATEQYPCIIEGTREAVAFIWLFASIRLHFNGPAYSALGLTTTATADEIKAAYQQLILVTHPDKKGGDAESFIKIQEAYESLSNPIAQFKISPTYLLEMFPEPISAILNLYETKLDLFEPYTQTKYEKIDLSLFKDYPESGFKDSELAKIQTIFTAELSFAQKCGQKGEAMPVSGVVRGGASNGDVAMIMPPAATTGPVLAIEDGEPAAKKQKIWNKPAGGWPDPCPHCGAVRPSKETNKSKWQLWSRHFEKPQNPGVVLTACGESVVS